MVIDKNVVAAVKNFLENYAEVHGLPSPGRNVSRITQSLIFLPAKTSYNKNTIIKILKIIKYNNNKYYKMFLNSPLITVGKKKNINLTHTSIWKNEEADKLAKTGLVNSEGNLDIDSSFNNSINRI